MGLSGVSPQSRCRSAPGPRNSSGTVLCGRSAENTGPDACRRDALHQLRYQGRGLQALIVQDSFIDIKSDFRRKQLSDLYLRYVHVKSEAAAEMMVSMSPPESSAIILILMSRR